MPGWATGRPCEACRKQKKKCDEARPSCARCARLHLDCVGAGERRFKFKQTYMLPKKGTGMPDTRENTGSLTDLTVARIPTGQIARMTGYLTTQSLRSDICDVNEAAFYYRAQITPFEFPCEVEPNVTYGELTPDGLTDASRHMLVMITLHHHRSIQNNGSTIGSPPPRVHQRSLEHMQSAIKVINEHLDSDLKRIGDEVLFDIWYSVITEVLISESPQWIFHYQAICQIIRLRGGLGNFINTTSWPADQTMQMLLYALAIEVTTHSSLLVPMFSQSQTKHWLAHLHNGQDTISSFPCPLPLVLFIVDINILRRKRHGTAFDLTLWHGAALDIIIRLRDAPVQDWINSKAFYQEEWSTIIRIFYAAITLFAINTLSDPALPPWTLTLKQSQRGDLFSLLPKAWKMPYLKGVLIWPAVIAGFEAGLGTGAEQFFIEAFLQTMYSEIGFAAPLHATAVLKRFWSSGGDNWDSCFTEAYAFSL